MKRFLARGGKGPRKWSRTSLLDLPARSLLLAPTFWSTKGMHIWKKCPGLLHSCSSFASEKETGKEMEQIHSEGENLGDASQIIL